MGVVCWLLFVGWYGRLFACVFVCLFVAWLVVECCVAFAVRRCCVCFCLVLGVCCLVFAGCWSLVNGC